MSTFRDKKRTFGNRRWRRSVGTRGPDRRGLALVVVLFVIAFSLVLSYSFLRLQAVSLRTAANHARVERALAAARAGAALALQRISSPDWAGVDQVLQQTVERTAGGQAFAVVSFQRVEGDAADTPPAGALQVVLRSRGVWQPVEGGTPTERTVELLVRLQPRVPADAVSPPDWEALESGSGGPSGRQQKSGSAGSLLSSSGSSPCDVTPNPPDFHLAQWFTVAAVGTRPLELNPGDRLVGPVWLDSDPNLYQRPKWPAEVRDQVLVDLGAAYGADPVVGRPLPVFPHPLSGLLVFGPGAKGKAAGDLGELLASTVRVSDSLRLPSWSEREFVAYRVFDGGFEYRARRLPRTLTHTKLKPTDDNPLGLFFRTGDVELADDVVVQGSLVVTGTVRVTGRGVYVGSCNWLKADGRPVQSDALRWPRLPAVVARQLVFGSDAFAVVEGAVVTSKEVKRQGAGFQLVGSASTNIRLAGTAVAEPLRQPYSRVRVQSWAGSSLRELRRAVDRTRNRHATLPISAYWLRLEEAGQARWFPIVAVLPKRRELLVVGELRAETPRAFRVQVRQRRFVQICGPVVTERLAAEGSTAWLLSSQRWQDLWNRWKSENAGSSGAAGSASGTGNSAPSQSFLEFLAEPSNFPGWGEPYSSYGLTVEPTFVVCRLQTVVFRLRPPLFRAFVDLRRWPEESGYRWEVLSWRVQP